MQTVSEAKTLIAQARALIADAARWTTGELARDSNGHAVRPTAPEACCWCLEGALYHVCQSSNFEDVFAIVVRYADDAPCIINDRRGHGAVLWLLDYVISNLNGAA